MSKVKGWSINSQNPTGETRKLKWNGITLNESVIKYKFLNGLNFSNQIDIFDTSEEGAWRQLKKVLKLKEWSLAYSYLNTHVFENKNNEEIGVMADSIELAWKELEKVLEESSVATD